MKSMCLQHYGIAYWSTLINCTRAASGFTWGPQEAENHLCGGSVIAARGRNQEEPQIVPAMESIYKEESYRNDANTLILPRPLSLLKGESVGYAYASETSLGKIINVARLTVKDSKRKPLQYGG